MKIKSYYKITGSTISKYAWIFLILVLSGYPLLAYAQLNQGAPSATPGGLLPQQQEPILPESVDNIITVPPINSRSSDPNQSFEISVAEFFITYDKSSLVSNRYQLDAKELARRYLNQHENRLTFASLEEIAQQLTNYFRDSGFILSRAIIPPQQIENDVVRISVFVGKMGGVNAIGNELYTTKTLTNPFIKGIGGAVVGENVESGLLRLSDLPGLQAVAVFKPGDDVGETHLSVKPVKEKSLDFYVRVDNYGVQSSGDIRLSSGVQVNNITKHRDRLKVDALKTFNSGDLRNARINYEITMPKLVHTLGASFSETRYDVERGPAKNSGISGDIELGDLYLSSSWLRSRNTNFSTQLGLSTKRAEADVNQFNLGVDRLTVARIVAIADGVDTRFRGIHRATITFHRGLDDFIGSMDKQGNLSSLGFENSRRELSGRFETISATYNRLQALSRNHSLLFRFSGQYSNDQLSSLEKMSLGGPYTVRAYPVGEFVNDRAIYSSLAWFIDPAIFTEGIAYGEYSWSDVLKLSLFFDYGWGKNRAGDGSVFRREIEGFGLQADFRFPDQQAFAEFSIARPLGDDEALNGDDFQFWFNVGFNL